MGRPRIAALPIPIPTPVPFRIPVPPTCTGLWRPPEGPSPVCGRYGEMGGVAVGPEAANGTGGRRSAERCGDLRRPVPACLPSPPCPQVSPLCPTPAPPQPPPAPHMPPRLTYPPPPGPIAHPQPYLRDSSAPLSHPIGTDPPLHPHTPPHKPPITPTYPPRGGAAIRPHAPGKPPPRYRRRLPASSSPPHPPPSRSPS